MAYWAGFVAEGEGDDLSPWLSFQRCPQSVVIPSFLLLFFLLVLSFKCHRRAAQVLPLSLSVDFLRLVLAVVDDHARSQGQVKVKTTAGTGADPGTTANALSPGTSPAAAAETVGSALSEEGGLKTAAAVAATAGQEDVGSPPVHATAVCFLSVGDLPRLYNRPGAIVRNLFKACKGEKPSGEVK